MIRLKTLTFLKLYNTIIFIGQAAVSKPRSRMTQYSVFGENKILNILCSLFVKQYKR